MASHKLYSEYERQEDRGLSFISWLRPIKYEFASVRNFMRVKRISFCMFRIFRGGKNRDCNQDRIG